MTCNPNWPEIQRHVEDAIPGQPTCDRPDVIVKVFKIKLDELMKDIRKSNHFGRVKAVIYTIEFQKRGLPHCHALIFLHEDDKIFSLDQIDYVISAELPSEVDDQIGFEAVQIVLSSIVVERLPFHEKGCNKVYFREDDDAEDVVDRATSVMSKFTGWMKANIIYPKGRSLTYSDYPTMFTWHDSDKEWRPHKNGMAIGRVRKKFARECVPFLSQDIPYRQQQLLQNNQVVFTDEEIQNYTLMEIEMILNGNNRSLTDFPNLPQINHNLLNMGTNRLIAEERRYNLSNKLDRFTNLYAGLNPQQKDVYENIMQVVNAKNGGLFVYGSGGTGKTYLWNTIIAFICSQGKIVLSVVSSGIASLLLLGGRTSHSRFHIPIDLDGDSCCGIDVTSDLAELIRQSELIIWDEAPLQHSIKEGADVPYWLDDFFVDKLIGRSIILRIKIDKYNLAPTCVHRSTTPIPKTAIEVPLSTVHEVRAPNMKPYKDGFENGIKCETTTTIIDTFEGSLARATMTNEDNPSDTHTNSMTSHANNDAVYVRSETLKEADTKEFDTKEVVMMEVDMKECDMRQVDVKKLLCVNPLLDKEKEENLEIDQIGEIEQEEKKYKLLGTLNFTLYTK
ncbi:putative PIF1 DNA helicase/replication protein A1-like protein [Tanacetum coccineum]